MHHIPIRRLALKINKNICIQLVGFYVLQLVDSKYKESFLKYNKTTKYLHCIKQFKKRKSPHVKYEKCPMVNWHLVCVIYLRNDHLDLTILFYTRSFRYDRLNFAPNLDDFFSRFFGTRSFRLII